MFHCILQRFSQVLIHTPASASTVRHSSLAAMNASAVCAELREIKLFMDRQVEKGSNITQVAKAQALQFINKVNHLPILTSPDANALVDAFDLAPFDPQHKADFASAIASKLSGGYVAQTTKLQQFNPDNYLTEQMWGQIGSSSIDIAVKSQLMSKVYVDNGVLHASEPSYGRGAIILATHGLHNQSPTTDTLHNLLKDIKHLVITSRGNASYPFQHVVKYPNNPSDLPDDRLRHAYGDVRPISCPENVQMSLQRLSKTKFLRASAAGISKGEQCSQVGLQSNMGAKTSFEQTAMMLMQNMQRSMNMMQHGSFNSDHAPPRQGDNQGHQHGASAAQCGLDQSRTLTNGTNARSLRGFVPRVVMDAPHHERLGALMDDTHSEAQPDEVEAGVAKPPAPSADHKDDPNVAKPPAQSADHTDDSNVAKTSARSTEPELPIDPVIQMRLAMAEGRATAKEASNNGKAAKKLALENGEQLAPFRNKFQRIADAARGPAPPAKSSSVKKRPSAQLPSTSSSTKRPHVSFEAETVYYNGGKIRMSETKGGYRCFPTLTLNPSDRLFRWGDGSIGSKTDAWNQALNHIDKTRMTQK